ncbi:MAG TPA: multiheme c-type cytochrome [Candidatus Eisenbacteria bacterium]
MARLVDMDVRTALVLLLATAAGSGCEPPQRASYVVTLDRPAASVVSVRIDLRGVPRDSLVLRGYAAIEAFLPTDLDLTGPEGAPLRATVGLRRVETPRGPVEVPVVVARGPLPPEVRVTYHVSPSRRQGDGHFGYAGFCSGDIGERFGFAVGRNLFLVPDPPSDAQAIDVRFDLPAGWAAATPWRKAGDRFVPGVDGKHGAEDLVAAAIGWGVFRPRTFQLGRTRFSLLFEQGIPTEEREDEGARLEAVARSVHDLFGRDLGAEYRVVVVPRSRDGDDINGEGWADGQGGTLVPLNDRRVRTFAQRLIDAYLTDPPYRSEITRPDEYWLVDGVRNLYAWRAVARAGLLTDEEVNRTIGSAYLNSYQASEEDHDVERAYAEHAGQVGRDYVAPAALLYLDHLIRASSSGSDSLDTTVRRLFAGSTARSLWSLLPSSGLSAWEAFRSGAVRGKAPVPFDQLIALAPTRADRDPPAGPPVREVTVAYTGDSYGFLENCGCKTNQAGGVARRATALRRIRAGDPGTILLDAGNSLLKPKSAGDVTVLAAQEQSQYVRMMDLMEYDAAAIGETELALGADLFRDAIRGVRTPYLVSNVARDGAPVAPSARIVERAGLRIAVIGVFDPPGGRVADLRLRPGNGGLSFADPVASLARAVDSLRARADLVIAIGRIAPATIRRIARACPGLDAIVSCEFETPRRAVAAGRSILDPEDQSGFLDSLLVLYTPLRNYGLQTARLGIDARGRIATARIEQQHLYEDVPDDPQVRDALTRFYDRVGRSASAQASVRPLFEWDGGRLKGRYVGAERCIECHEEEYAQWKRTPHASAFKTLLDLHRHYQPRCVSCHVVGYGTPHGYQVGAPERPLGDVQCETCHGPGAVHVGDPRASNIRKDVPERVCLECHNPEHSARFDYAEKLPLVRHEAPASLQATR